MLWRPAQELASKRSNEEDERWVRQTKRKISSHTITTTHPRINEFSKHLISL